MCTSHSMKHRLILQLLVILHPRLKQCSVYFTVTVEEELKAIEKVQESLRKETDQPKGEQEKREYLDSEKLSTIKQSSRTIEVIYSSESQGDVLTRVYFPFDPKVSLDCFILTIAFDKSSALISI